MFSDKAVKEAARGRISRHLDHEQPSSAPECLSGGYKELKLFLIRKMMYSCDGYHRIKIVSPYAGQAEVCFENIPPVQRSRHNEIREGDLLSCRHAPYQAAFERNIEDPSGFETLDRVIEILNFRCARRIIIGVGMDEVVVIPESFLIRRRHDSPRSLFLEQGFSNRALA